MLYVRKLNYFANFMFFLRFNKLPEDVQTHIWKLTHQLNMQDVLTEIQHKSVMTQTEKQFQITSSEKMLLLCMTTSVIGFMIFMMTVPMTIPMFMAVFHAVGPDIDDGCTHMW